MTARRVRAGAAAAMTLTRRIWPLTYTRPPASSSPSFDSLNGLRPASAPGVIASKRSASPLAVADPAPAAESHAPAARSAEAPVP